MSIRLNDRRDWTGKVVRVFKRYWMHNCPVPADPIAYLYRTAYTKAEWLALRYLKEHQPNALSCARTFDLFWTDDVSGTGNCPHVTFNFPTNLYLPDVGIKLSELPESTQRVFRPWITDVQRFRSLQRELRDRCRGVMGNPTGTGNGYISRTAANLDPKCNTPAQLVALWPEIQPFMLKAWRREVQLKVRRPRPPKRVGYAMWRDGRERFATPEQFRCTDPESTESERTRFAEINEILTMMSLADVVSEPDGYPTFHGTID